MRDLRFRVLGPLQAWRGGEPVALGGSTMPALLTGLLLSANHDLSGNVLASLVWDAAAAPAHPHAAVQNGVMRLRRALGPNVVETSHHGYRIRAGIDELDLLEFRHLMATTEDHLARGAEPTALAALDRALGLWQVPVLGNVRSGAVQRDVVPQLMERFLDAHERRAELCLRLERHGTLVGELAEVARAFPFRERLAGSLMVALYHSDRQADALAVYERLRRSLAEELGIDPGEQLRELHLKILRADPDVYLASHQSVRAVQVEAGAAATAVVPSQLPPGIADFTGRDREVSLVSDLLTSQEDVAGGPRIAMVGGPAGAGKTTLAVHVAHLLRPEFPDGQLYVDLQGTTCPAEPADILSRFLRALGVAGSAIPADLEERAAMYRSMMADRRMLVVLDNAAGERQIRPMMPTCPDSAVIVTARKRITTLPGGRPMQLGMLDDPEAVRLLEHVAGADRISGELPDAHLLVKLCGGLPLALRIAGARFAARPHWRLSTLTDLLSDRRSRLSELSHGDLDVRASLMLSCQELAPVPRTLLRRIGLLDAPDFPAWVCAALLDTSIGGAREAADCLIDAQLLEVIGQGTPSGIRYRCHDLIRELAREFALKLEPPAARQSALARVFGALLGLAEQAHRQVYGGDYSVLHGSAPRWQAADMAASSLIGQAPLAWFEAERLPILAAISQSAELDMDELCWDLAWTAATLFEARAYFDDWRVAQEQALVAVRRTGNRRGEAAMLASSSTRLFGQRAVSEALKLGEQALRIFTDLGDPHGCALAQLKLAVAETAGGKLDSALARCDQVRRDQGGGDRAVLAVALREMARVHLALNNEEAASHFLNEALWIARDIHSARIEAFVLHMLGELYLQQGKPDLAQHAFGQVLVLVRTGNDRLGEVHAQLGLAETLLSQGQPDRAAARLRVVVQAASQLGEQGLHARALLDLGTIHARQGDRGMAQRFLLHSAEIFTRCGMPLWIPRVQAVLATIRQPADGGSPSLAGLSFPGPGVSTDGCSTPPRGSSHTRPMPAAATRTRTCAAANSGEDAS